MYYFRKINVQYKLYILPSSNNYELYIYKNHIYFT